MIPRLRGPAALLGLALVLLLVAVILDRGSEGNRDAALLLGSFALYALLPAAAVWLLVAVVRHHGSGRDGGRR